MGLKQEVANHLYRLGVTKTYIKDKSGLHPGALHNGKIETKRPRWHAIKLDYKSTTNHQRCVMLRARKQGLSVDEYLKKYPKSGG